MLKRFTIVVFTAVFLLCLTSWTRGETGLPKSPNWRFGGECPGMREGLWKYQLPPRGWNDLTEDQKIINSWGYKARPVEEIKHLVPEVFYEIVSHPDIWGDFRINETEFIPSRGPYWQAYQEATEKYRGTCDLDEDGWLHNYKAGCPFPDVDPENDPQGGSKLVWNFLKRFQWDDRESPFVTNLLDRAGNTRVMLVKNLILRFNGRLELDPKPLYEPNPRQIDYVYAVPFVEPYNMRGVITVIQRYEISKPDDMWMYLPAMRRVRRMATTQTQDKYPGGMDCTWDTSDCFMGNVVNFDISYLGRKELLMPILGTTVPQIDMNGLAGVDSYFQRRNCYVVKISYKQPITMTDIIFYIGPEMHHSCYVLSKDRRGNDWIFHAYLRGKDKDWWECPSNMNMIDLSRRHTTRVGLSWYNPNAGHTPADYTVEQLIKTYATR